MLWVGRLLVVGGVVILALMATVVAVGLLTMPAADAPEGRMFIPEGPLAMLLLALPALALGAVTAWLVFRRRA